MLALINCLCTFNEILSLLALNWEPRELSIGWKHKKQTGKSAGVTFTCRQLLMEAIAYSNGHRSWELKIWQKVISYDGKDATYIINFHGKLCPEKKYLKNWKYSIADIFSDLGKCDVETSGQHHRRYILKSPSGFDSIAPSYIVHKNFRFPSRQSKYTQ